MKYASSNHAQLRKYTTLYEKNIIETIADLKEDMK